MHTKGSFSILELLKGQHVRDTKREVMKPTTKTSAFLKSLSSRTSQFEGKASYNQSFSTREETASGISEQCLRESKHDEQPNNSFLTAGDRYLLENRRMARPTRHSPIVRRGKLVNLGMRLGFDPIALIVTVMREADEIGASIHFLPTGKDLVLPPNLTILLLSGTNKVLQSVSSKEQDACIQLEPFKGKSGVRFAVEISLNGVKVKESFQL